MGETIGRPNIQRASVMLKVIGRLKKQAVDLRLKGEKRREVWRTTMHARPCPHCGKDNLVWRRPWNGTWILLDRSTGDEHWRTCPPRYKL